MNRLYLLKLGETIRLNFLTEMAERLPLLREKRQKVLFLLPSTGMFQQVRQEIRQVSSQLLGWVELKSFDKLAKELSQQQAKSLELSSLAQDLLMKKIIQKLDKENQLNYFKPLLSFPGFVGTCTHLIRELRQSGVTAEEFAALVEAKDRPEKDVEVLALYEAYESELKAKGLADLEEQYFLACKYLEESGVLLPYNQIYLSDFFWFNPLQFELLNEMRKVRPVTCSLIYEKNKSPYQCVDETYSRLVGMGFEVFPVDRSNNRHAHLSQLLDQVFMDNRQKKLSAPVQFIYTARPEQEAEVMIARLKNEFKNNQLEPDEVAVLIRQEQTGHKIRRQFVEAGIPVSRPEVDKVSHQSVVTFLMNAFKAKASQGSKERVRALLRSVYWEAMAGMDSAEIDQACTEFQLPNWQAWGEFAKNHLSEKAHEAFYILKQAIDSIPFEAKAVEWTQVVRAFYEACGVKQQIMKQCNQLELYNTWIQLEQALTSWEQEIAMIQEQDQVLSLKEWMAVFNQLLNEAVILKSRPAAHGVYILTPEQAGGRQFRVVYILGLTEGNFPLRNQENWLYQDQERKLMFELGVPLPISAQTRQQEKYYFAVALSCASEQIYLSTCKNDETLPSPYFEQIRSMVALEKNQEHYYGIEDFLATSISQVKHEGDLKDYVLLKAFSENESDDLVAYGIEHCFDETFWKAVLMEESRRLDDMSAFNGFLRNEISQDIYTVSQLETYLKCPFAYFLQYVLNITDSQEPSDVPDGGTIGQIYHAVVAEFLSSYLGQTLLPAKKGLYREKIEQLFYKISLDLYGPEKRSAYWPYEAQKMLEFLDLWLDREMAEQQSQSFRPYRVEWRFGYKEPFFLDTPVGKIQLRGQVDRIDCSDHYYLIYDYKRKTSPKSRETIEEGQDLQLPLYLLALSHSLGQQDQVIGGGYYLIEKAEKNGGVWLKDYISLLPFRQSRGKQVGHLEQGQYDEFMSQFQLRLVSLAQEIQKGQFPIRPSSECSPFCPGMGICRYEAKGEDHESFY